MLVERAKLKPPPASHRDAMLVPFTNGTLSGFVSAFQPSAMLVARFTTQIPLTSPRDEMLVERAKLKPPTGVPSGRNVGPLYQRDPFWIRLCISTGRNVGSSIHVQTAQTSHRDAMLVERAKLKPPPASHRDAMLVPFTNRTFPGFAYAFQPAAMLVARFTSKPHRRPIGTQCW